MKGKDIENQQGELGSSQKDTSSKRRKVLVGGGVISAGAVLPQEWTSTVLRSLVLPAHAQTSSTMITSGQFTGSGAIPT